MKVDKFEASEKTEIAKFNEFLSSYPSIEEIKGHANVYKARNANSWDAWDLFPDFFDPSEAADTECNDESVDEFYIFKTATGKRFPVAYYFYRECGSTEWDEITYDPTEGTFVVEEIK